LGKRPKSAAKKKTDQKGLHRAAKKDPSFGKRRRVLLVNGDLKKKRGEEGFLVLSRKKGGLFLKEKGRYLGGGEVEHRGGERALA